eukprot:2954765-Rhodomonas_salina.8
MCVDVTYRNRQTYINRHKNRQREKSQTGTETWKRWDGGYGEFGCTSSKLKSEYTYVLYRSSHPKYRSCKATVQRRQYQRRARSLPYGSIPERQYQSRHSSVAQVGMVAGVVRLVGDTRSSGRGVKVV